MDDLLTGTAAPIMSGFADLDEVWGGFQRSDLVILAARPSVGKSTLGLNMAMANAKAGQKCAIFSLDMTADQLAIRALAGETGIDSHRIRLGLYTQSQEQIIINAIGELSELPIYIDDTPYQGMVEIRGKARRLDLDKGVDLIMVDYLQLVQGQHRGGPVNRVQEITEISRSLKVMAGELNTAVIACSQMSRMVENRPSSQTSGTAAPSSRTQTSWRSSTGRTCTPRRRSGDRPTRARSTPATSPRSSWPRTGRAPMSVGFTIAAGLVYGLDKARYGRRLLNLQILDCPGLHWFTAQQSADLCELILNRHRPGLQLHHHRQPVCGRVAEPL